MKVNNKYLYFLIGAITLYTFYELQKPKTLDWSETFHFRDEIPFGTELTHQLLPGIVGNGEARHVFRSPYEFFTIEGNDEGNMLMLANVMNIGRDDTKALLEYVGVGHTVVLAAENFSGAIRDTLDFEMSFDEQLISTNVTDVQAALAGQSVTSVQFIRSEFPQKAFEFPSVVASTFFTNLEDSAFEVLARNDEDKAVLVKYTAIEGGELYLSSMPLAFTNYFVLDQGTTDFAAALFSLFPKKEQLIHNEYYQMGRMEAGSIIRFLLMHEALRWAYFLLIIGLAVFVLFEIKRRQRAIPIINPLKNTTLEFVSTLGRLHYRQQDHANLAKKRVQYWLEHIRVHYNLATGHIDDHFLEELARKSGKDRKWLELLANTASKVNTGEQLSEPELLAFEKLLNKFYGIDKSE